MKRNAWVAAILCVAALSASLIAGGARPRPVRAVILFTGEQHGYLLPCGCTEGLLGGIDRRATAVRQIVEKGHAVLLVDNGGLIDGVSAQAKIKRTYLVAAMEIMGYRATGLGKADLDAGYDSAMFELEGTEVALLCANVVSRDGSRLFKSGKIFRVGSLKIAVTAAIDPELIDATHPAREELKFLEPSEALRDVLSAWGSKADVRVLLYHGPHKKAEKIVREVEGLDLVISGYDNDLMVKEIARVNGVPIGITGLKGKYLGRVDVLGGEGSLMGPVREIELSDEIPKDVDMLELVREYRRVLDGEWDKLVTRRRKGVPGGKRFVASHLCGRCHRAAWEKLKTNRHGRAMESLEADGSARDPECVVCHVVGLGYKSGYISKKRTPQVSHVGCSCCHGPGSDHMVNPVMANAPKAEAELSCLQCHNLDHSPMFDNKTYWPEIAHPTPEAERKELAEP